MNTPRLITNSAGTTVWQWDGEAFGNTPPNANPSNLGTFTFNLRYPGQYADVETGLYYNGHRDYDSNSGRYVESDPAGLRGGSFSTYAYVGGNPLSLSDPSGLVPNPAEGFCLAGPNPICIGGIVVDVGSWILAGVGVGTTIAVASMSGDDSPVKKPAIPNFCPDNLCEQLALAAAQAGAHDNADDLQGMSLVDEPRLVALYGPGPWMKRRYTHNCPGGRKIVIHYFSNGTLNVELKIKYGGTWSLPGAN